MEKQIFYFSNQLTNKAMSFLTVVSVLISVLTPLSSARAAEWYDSGWIYVDDLRFHGDTESNECPGIGWIATVTANYAGNPWHAWVDLNAPAGNYSIDIELAYGHTSTYPPQPNETMRLYSKAGLNSTTPPTTYTDVADVPDMGDNINDNCDDFTAALRVYQDVVSRTMQFPANGDLFIQGTGQSIDIKSVRIYGYKEEPAAPLLVINKTVDKSNTVPGDEVVYTLNYANIGNGPATGVVVKDPFNYVNQEYITFISATPAPSSGNDTWNIGTLNAGQSGQITIRAKVDNDVPVGTTEIKNRGSIQSNELSLIYSNCANFFVTVVGNPSLTITKSVNKLNASPGDEIVYTLSYQNTGQGAASNVVITDPFNNLNQNYLTFISATPAPSSGNDTWNIGTLNAGQSGQITIRAKISSSVPSGNTEIKNRAAADSNETNLVYSNYVSTFVSGGAGLTIDKSVRNVSGGGGFSDSIEIRPGDEVEFSLAIRSTGSNTISNVKAWDSLPVRLNYVTGSTTVDGVSVGDGIITGGIYIGDIGALQTKTVKFKAKAAADSMFNIGVTTLTNYGYANANGIAAINDTATVNVKKDSGCSPSLHINKQVRNITQGSNYWTDTLFANPGDEIEVLIEVNSVGNETANNSKIKDVLPAKLNYIPGSTTVDGSYRADGIISSDGILLGNLIVGDSREIKFKTKISSAGEFTFSSINLINYAYAWADKTCGEINDSAQITVTKGQTNNSAISISKLGRNISQGQTGLLDSFMANPGEEVEFSIQVTNVGNAELTNVKIWDNLPNNVSIISGSTTIDGISWGGDVIGAGLVLGSVPQGQTKTIKFRAQIASADKFGSGSTTLVNTAYVSANNVAQLSDQASIIIHRSGEVLGTATYVKTGADIVSLVLLMIISCFITFIFYCRLREDKLLEILNNKKGNRFYHWLIGLYFKLKFIFTVKLIRFKKVYW
jgi:uncharacterized repeat protein (TIGR01451 family)